VAIVDRAKHRLVETQAVKNAYVITFDGLQRPWPSDVALPRGTLVNIDQKGVYRAEEFDSDKPWARDENSIKCPPSGLSQMPPRWLGWFGNSVSWASQVKMPLFPGTRLVGPWAAPADLSATPVVELDRPLVLNLANGETWFVGSRNRFDGKLRVSKAQDYRLVRCRPMDLAAQIHCSEEGLVRVTASRDGQAIEQSGFLWQVDDQPWQVWASGRPLDLNRLPVRPKVLRVRVVSADGVDVSAITEQRIAATQRE
jgi:hypothetical protein